MRIGLEEMIGGEGGIGGAGEERRSWGLRGERGLCTCKGTVLLFLWSCG